MYTSLMDDLRKSTGIRHAPPLHTVKPMPQTTFNRVFATIYTFAILSLLYHHTKILVFPKTLISFSITLILLISDLILAFMWISMTALRISPVLREEFPENLKKLIKKSEYPGLDVFICTADPYKEPPIGVINTVLSVMAYDYPKEKLSVYVSDDGGSEMTLFALMEAAKFALHWLPFCEDNNLLERCPEAYFESLQTSSSEKIEKIKMMYESMKLKVENVLERGKVEEQYINGDQEQKAFTKWTKNFSRQDHPTVIEVLLDTRKDTDINGHQMPNLIYVSRQKNKNYPHHFKAGALNTLLRVSAIMTNAPVILTLDCDMYSNNPQTPLHALCYLSDPKLVSELGYVQFPQIFHGINKNDIYACEYKRLFLIQSIGFDGLMGPNHVGTGCFFNRRVYFGGPLTLVQPEIPELSPAHVVDKPLQSPSISALAHQVASCDYENNTKWGSKIGYRYGSLVEDYYTGYRLQCEGWKSIFCIPKRAAFLGDAPMSLVDLLNQQKRWAIGLLEVAFSKYCTLTYGVQSMGPLMGLGYSLIAFWPIWSIPIFTYAFLPQLALLHRVYIFPKASELQWFMLYIFLFIGSYAQDCLEIILTGGSIFSWWNDQRIWHIRGLTCYLFGSIEFLLKNLKISKFGFNVTSKVIDDQLKKRYDQGIFEFGIHSPMFVTLSMVAIINFISLIHGLLQIFSDGTFDSLLLQILISGFVVLCCCPIYEAIFLRSDDGKMPIKTTFMAAFFSLCFYLVSFLFLV